MTRDDIARMLGEALGIHLKDAISIVESITGEIVDILKGGGVLQIRGFGTFKAFDKKAKPGRIISTGERVMIPLRRMAKFIPGIVLKQELKKKSDAEQVTK
ncbi:MAG: HU family DNA-binding protein [Candidatus Hydrogenedentota bacterium]